MTLFETPEPTRICPRCKNEIQAFYIDCPKCLRNRKLEEIVDDIIERNPIIYERLAEI